MQNFITFPNQFKSILTGSILVSTLLFSCGSFKSNKVKKVYVPQKSLNMRDSINKYYTFHQLNETLQAHLIKSDGVAKEDASAFLESLQSDYLSYAPNKLVIDSIREILLEGKILKVDVYGGNWCSDTRYGMGGLTHILDDLGVMKNNFRYIRVDKEKKIMDFKIEGIEITRVPLVIFFIGNKEIGMIIENPTESWEKNLLQLLQTKH